MKITLKNIIRYEQLTGKSFNEFSMEIDDLISLLYAIENPDIDYNLFKESVSSSKKALIKRGNEINRYLELSSQYYQKNISEDKIETRVNTQKQKVGDVAIFLIYSGLDAHFVLNEMELQDIPLFYNGAIEKTKAKLENERRWTYLGILPHLSSPITEQQLVTFSWEEEEVKKQSEGSIKRDEKRFNEFMNNGKKI